MLGLSLYRVRGKSMEPYAHHDDYVLVRKFLPWEKPRESDMIIALDPRDPSRVLFKRIAGTGDGGYTILGDNADASTDSRAFGLVPRQHIQGKVVTRICHK